MGRVAEFNSLYIHYLHTGHSARPVGSDKYLVFNQHQLSSHCAHAHKLLDCYIEPIRGEIDSVSANNK